MRELATKEISFISGANATPLSSLTDYQAAEWIGGILGAYFGNQAGRTFVSEGTLNHFNFGFGQALSGLAGAVAGGLGGFLLTKLFTEKLIDKIEF